MIWREMKRRSLHGDERGVTALEFSLLITPLLLLVLGGLDLGMNVYIRTVLAGALEKASRNTTVETANTSTIDTELVNTVKTVLPGATVTVQKGRFYRYNQLNALERITYDANNNGVLDIGDKWEDVDNDGTRSTVTTGELNSIGGSDDIVRYNVTVTYPRFTPINKLMGGASTMSISKVMLVKRQPYANQGTPTERTRIS